MLQDDTRTLQCQVNVVLDIHLQGDEGHQDCANEFHRHSERFLWESNWRAPTDFHVRPLIYGSINASRRAPRRLYKQLTVAEFDIVHTVHPN